MSLIISSYQLLKESVESEFKITFDIFKNNDIQFVLKYPSNPILDCQIINLHEQPIQQAIIKIHKLIEEDEFGISSRVQLIQLKNWISKIINLTTSSNVNAQFN
tara:strand:+ start:339 stop:650 length:312 start_codon:yes stop_codon:yes gene_type:complete